MRKLDRDPNGPACLAKYASTQEWKDLVTEDKNETRISLERMQGRRCAYCEGPLDEWGHHIDHFRPRSRFRDLTFEWTNMFLSCDSKGSDLSCGRYKDGRGDGSRGRGASEYNPDNLLDPCVDDLSAFLDFKRDGNVRQRRGLEQHDAYRAGETIRVFKLQAPRLRQRRKILADFYYGDNQIRLESLSKQDRKAYIEAEIQRTANEPFSGVIRQLLEQLVR